MPTDRLRSRHADVQDMSADLIEGRRFGQSWRGYDPDEVKQFLAQVAAQVRALRERCDTMDAARREAEARALHPQLDEATLMSAVGEETAGILRSAHSAASEIAAKAESNAQTIVATAQARADDLVTEAESLLAKRTAEAEAAASDIRGSALADAERVKQAAQNDAETVAARAASEYQETVQAAQALREKILTDLARRRKLGSVQIEQLRAGRERLLDAYLVVRRTLEETTDELQKADAEARAAADAVGRQYAERAEETVDLRHEDGWDALSAFSEAPPVVTAGAPEAPGDGAPAPAPAMAPRPAEVALAPASAPTVQSGPAPNGPGSSAPNLGAPVFGSSVLGAGAIDLSSAAPTTISLLPSPPVTPGGGGGTSSGAATGRASGFSAGPVPDDEVESVRIVRATSAPSARARASAPRSGPAARGRRDGNEGPVAEPEPTTGSTTGPQANDQASNGHDQASNGHDVPDGEPSEARDVQGLFARIRASRAEATTTARKTLYQSAEEEVSAAEAPLAAPTGLGDLDGGSPPSDNGAGTAAGPTGTYQEFFNRRDSVTKRLESSLARKLKRALQDEQNSILDRLRNLKVAAAPANVLPSPEEHPDRFVDAGRPLLEEAARAGADLVSSLWGGATAGGSGRNAVEDLADELGRAIAEPLRQRLELAFQSIDEDNVELAEALGAAYREWKTQRIEAVARDQVAAAFSRGAYLAFPDQTALRWVAAASDEPCPDCEDNALAGQQVKAEPWPTGQLYPPAHPGCRCALAPAVAAETATAGLSTAG